MTSSQVGPDGQPDDRPAPTVATTNPQHHAKPPPASAPPAPQPQPQPSPPPPDQLPDAALPPDQLKPEPSSDPNPEPNLEPNPAPDGPMQSSIQPSFEVKQEPQTPTRRPSSQPPPPQPGLQSAAPIGDSLIKHDPLAHGIVDHALANGNAALDVFGAHPMDPQQFSLMMALASLSATTRLNSRQVGPPPTVAPGDVSLPTPMNELHELRDPLTTPNGNQHARTPAAVPPSQGLESFARIEFADSVFQMTTYAVIIGRDQRALEQARRDERRADEYQRRADECAAQGLPPPPVPTYDKGKFSKSYVSEEGGMLGPESDGDDNPRAAKRRKTSTGSGSQQPREHNQQQNQQQRQQSIAVEQATGHDSIGAGASSQDLISNRQYVSHTPGAAVVDLELLKPSPDHVPFIGIHSPGPGIAAKTKAISREHLKIEYHQAKGVFEAIPLHTNGFFHEDVHHKQESVVLKSGDRLQIKDVDFVFIINGVPHGQTGAEELEDEDAPKRRHSEGGKEMSFEFESSHGDNIRDSSDEEDKVEVEELAATKVLESDGEDSDGDEDANQAAEEEEDAPDDGDVMETVETDETGAQVVSQPGPVLDPSMPQKKRGPGRPPKNGIRSKREERLLRKIALEEAKRNAPPPVPGEPPIKRKVGRPRKHPLPEGAEDRPEKRKYKPRKPKEEGEGGEDGEKLVKEKRREKPKTPPLELKKEDFTEDQLQKPNKNYGVLIDEVLSEAPPDGLTLKQIYKRIQKKYPYYFFVVDTKGWESSVRHNLIGNDAFKKNEETHLWCRVPGIELDAGKKRKAASPDHPATQMHATQWTQQMAHPQYQPAQGYHPGQGPPPGYSPTHGLPQVGAVMQGQQRQPVRHPPGVAAGQPAAQRPAYQPPHGQAGPPGAQAPTPTPTQLPGYMQAGGQRHMQMGGPTGSYNASYPAKPPASLPTAASPGGVHNAAPNAVHVSPIGHPRPAAGYGQAGHPGIPQAGVPGAGPHAPAPHSGAVNGGASHAHQRQHMAQQPPPAPPLKPAIDADVANFLKNFRVQVISQLEKRLPKAAELVAMSVINRGLGLSTSSLAGAEHAGFEKIILGVFDTAKQKFPRLADPGLISALTGFKTHWVDTLKSKLGEARSEALLLSAIDRVLGLCDGSIMQPAGEVERKEYEEAENLFMPLIRDKVLEFQRSAAVVNGGGGVGTGVSNAPTPAGPSAAPTPAPAIATAGR
ncbi:hypothetical protein GGTG_08018 [Gaeumannomyces tritici R3-111a-1]|uniref:Fork-head domain-containing protein n=1 Tax=Gaeumannomyces tritici (strain R3-111a-1) TaxID=644352 RepID=J3P3D1_GAET3|nr:hypothetical protein GGTG_08018 [Gaeumannomyces tritici R3-111a-1]EJT74173.1 hypothetical protein GGTG_08018 [Gaeumannomyces tritici R3-111a-1]